jgi:hypothetical protein
LTDREMISFEANLFFGESTQCSRVLVNYLEQVSERIVAWLYRGE